MVKDVDAYEQVIRLLSHDLRNPLTAVQLNAQLIERAAASEGREKEQRWASLIASAARRMDGMIGQLVVAERIRSGVIKLAFEVTALDELLAEAAGVLGSGRVQVNPPKPSVMLSVDRQYVVQALDHLFCLALRETDPAAAVSVDVRVGESEVVLTLRSPRPPTSDDNGPNAVLPRSEPGQGIALFIARTLIEGHGGGVQVDDDLATCLVFKVRLPRSSA